MMDAPPDEPTVKADDESGGAFFHPRVLAIDPGSEESGICLWEYGRVTKLEKLPNSWVLGYLEGIGKPPQNWTPAPILVIEDLRFYGGNAFPLTLIRTAQWIGAFAKIYPGQHYLIPRKEVVTELTGNPKAGDAIIRQACIDVLGEVPTKASPNANYPRRPVGDEWSAIAIVLAFHELSRDGRDRALEQLI